MSLLGYIVCFVICPVMVLTFDDLQSIEEDADLGTLELIRKYNYSGEHHQVITEDGYILNMQRLAKPGAIPVLIMHGLFDSSAAWVMMGPGHALGYVVSDAGFDVWLGNTRGNSHSRSHVSLSPESTKFWDFSFHEMGVYDLPCMIDYILEKTGYHKLHYIGHSQGGTAFFIMGSERPEYMNKIMLMHGLAAVASFQHTISPPLIYLAPFSVASTYFTEVFGSREFFMSSWLTDMFSKHVCADRSIGIDICSNILFMFQGFDPEQTNMTTLPVLLGHVPAGASTKQVQHFFQIRALRSFRKFDYGPFVNMMKYKTIKPPLYKMSNVRANIAIYYAANDWFVMPKDARLVAAMLPNVFDLFQVPFQKFNHLDFLYGSDAKSLIWDRLVENLLRYNNVTSELNTLNK